jgi:hypothetical protein
LDLGRSGFLNELDVVGAGNGVKEGKWSRPDAFLAQACLFAAHTD